MLARCTQESVTLGGVEIEQIDQLLRGQQAVPLHRRPRGRRHRVEDPRMARDMKDAFRHEGYWTIMLV